MSLLKGLLFVVVFTPLCWIGVILLLNQLQRLMPDDPFLDDMLEPGMRYAWVMGLFLALLLTAALAGLGIPPFAATSGRPAATSGRPAATSGRPAAKESTAAPAPSPTPFSLNWSTPEPYAYAPIPPLEELTEEQLMALIEGGGTPPWLIGEDSYRQVVAGGVVIPADNLAVDLSAFPRPPGDNGRGIHWIPTTSQPLEVIDRFLPEVQAMGIRWVVFLNGLDDWAWKANDYLVERLVAAGIEPVMRLATPVAPLDPDRVNQIVRHYRPLGVRYYQIYNEPNLHREWGEEGGHTPERFADLWAEGATAVLAGGGLPGLAAMSPGGDMSDYDYLARSLAHLLALGRYDLLNRTWLSVHNYTGGMPADFIDDPAGFRRYRRYAEICRVVLGTELPMIGTEGGPAPADGVWTSPASEEQEAKWIVQAYRFMGSRRERYFLAYSPWLLANFAGGGHDPRWESAAWFQVDGTRPVVAVVKRMTKDE